ncbi:MAG TPA: hypothetical protein VFM93_09190 [Candidatus Limnocylindria bacterium]|nr:hypothetical protein [Candidatus Limnocylindria bacterium]
MIGALTTEPAKVTIPLPGFVANACVYASADGTLTVATGPRNLSRTEVEAFMRLVPGTTSVSGVGDVAFAARGDVPQGMAGAASIFALKGGTYFTVQATSRSKSSDALQTALTELARSVAGRL